MNLGPPGSLDDLRKRKWDMQYDLTIVWRRLTGERSDSSVLDAAWAEFLKTHLSEIEDIFSSFDDATRKELLEIARLSSREHWGQPKRKK